MRYSDEYVREKFLSMLDDVDWNQLSTNALEALADIVESEKMADEEIRGYCAAVNH